MSHDTQSHTDLTYSIIGVHIAFGRPANQSFSKGVIDATVFRRKMVLTGKVGIGAAEVARSEADRMRKSGLTSGLTVDKHGIPRLSKAAQEEVLGTLANAVGKENTVLEAEFNVNA